MMMSLLDVDVEDTKPFINDYLLSDDIWSKFQMDQELNSAIFSSLDSFSCDLFCPPKCLIHHDCMWTGLCGSKEHNSEESRPQPAGPDTPVKLEQVPQQSLLKPNIRMSVNPHTILPMMAPTATRPIVSTLQTPPMSDDEESKPTQTLQTLQDVIFKNIIDDNGDLSDYFKAEEEDFALLDGDIKEEEEEEEEEEEDEDEEEDEEEDEDTEEEQDQKKAMLMRASFAAESDHSYHKGNQSALRQIHLGIETPSDSEEEIDVVSLGDKYNVCKTSVGGALPTNPSSQDRHQLQRTMQSRFPQGVKTKAPPARGKTAPRPNGRSRQYKRVTQAHRPYKRRSAYGHSSDSEQEPSEKRSLHNNMERQRRIDLRNLFEDLKVLVPEVNKKQRAAKVLILRGAAQYCRSLTNASTSHHRQVEELRRQQERLRARVSALRRNLAAGR